MLVCSHDTPEEVLLALAGEGSHDAFAELVERSRKQCIGMAFRILGNVQDAEEEVQNAYCRAFARFHTFKREAQFSTWLNRIVINHCYMRLRRSKRMRVISFTCRNRNDEEYQILEPVDPSTPELNLGERQFHTLIRDELKKVPLLLRTPLELHLVEELPLPDVARRMDAKLTTVKARLHRGQLYLRARMQKHIASSSRRERSEPH